MMDELEMVDGDEKNIWSYVECSGDRRKVFKYLISTGLKRRIKRGR